MPDESTNTPNRVAERAQNAEAAEDITVVFDRNLAGGYEEGDRVTLTRTDFVNGLIDSGIAHEATDDDYHVGEAGPEVIAPAPAG